MNELVAVDPKNPATLVMFVLMSAVGAVSSVVYGKQAFEVFKMLRTK